MTRSLYEYLQKSPPFALAFSGGVDSAYLLYAAMKNHCQLTAYFIKTPFQPQFELDDALRLAEELSAPLKVLSLDILDREVIISNPADRCYFCKKALFTALTSQAKRDGYTLVFDGTNASDQTDDRPGMKALTELQVLSPLRECGLTKQTIRQLSKEAGLFTYDKPSYACLATRIPTGTRITGNLLNIRLLDGCARLQLLESQFPQALRQKNQIRELLLPHFKEVLLDLTPRKGDD